MRSPAAWVDRIVSGRPVGWSNRNYRHVAFPHLRFGPSDEMNYDEINAIVPEAASRTVHCFSVKWLYGSLYRKFNIITDIVA